MNDRPRRRRSDDEPERGGLPLFPLVLIVIFAGLLLGGVLAHFFGGSKAAKRTPAPLAAILPTALPRLAAPTPSPRESPVASPKSSAVPSASAVATSSPPIAPTPTPKPKPRATHATGSPTPPPTAAAVSPSPARATTAASPAARTAAVVTAAPNYVAAGSDQAAGIVRSYLGALARGDRATATSYLAHGLPGEVFMDSNARIVSLHSSAAAGSQYKVVADVQTGTGEYYVTFTLEPGNGGLQITDHYAIKVR